METGKKNNVDVPSGVRSAARWQLIFWYSVGSLVWLFILRECIVRSLMQPLVLISYLISCTGIAVIILWIPWIWRRGILERRSRSLYFSVGIGVSIGLFATLDSFGRLTVPETIDYPVHWQIINCWPDILVLVLLILLLMKTLREPVLTWVKKGNKIKT